MVGLISATFFFIGFPLLGGALLRSLTFLDTLPLPTARTYPFAVMFFISKSAFVMEFYGSDIDLPHVPVSSGLTGSTRRMVFFVSIMLVITELRLFSLSDFAVLFFDPTSVM